MKNHIVHYPLAALPEWADAAYFADRWGTLDGLFDPFDGQVLSQPPIGRFKVVCEEMKGTVEHHDDG